MKNSYYAATKEPTALNLRYRASQAVTRSILKILGVSETELEGEAIYAIENLSGYPNGHFHVGNAVKYLWTIGMKNKDETTEDLIKAQSYLSRYLEIEKTLPWYKKIFRRHPDGLATSVYAIADLIQTMRFAEDTQSPLEQINPDVIESGESKNDVAPRNRRSSDRSD